jgi:branched-chain amino acid transport system permease protein
MRFFSSLSGRAVLLLCLLLAVLLIPLLGQPYYVKIVTRMVIFGLAALSLDLLVGYGGLISFGHAAFFGLGAYVVGILSTHGVTQAWWAWPAAMLASGMLAALIGAVSMRASGLYFIFVTLAFSQMLFYLMSGLKQYGGDDGFSLAQPTMLFPGTDTSNPVALFYVAIGLLLLVLFITHRMMRSRFGQVIRAASNNDIKLSSIGLSSLPYKVVLFAVSGAICGLAGALMASLSEFVAPSLLSWLVSGELLMMVILGSVGTLVGPILGAALFVFCEQMLSDLTDHWMLILGPLLVARVLFMSDGIYGLLGRLGRAKAAASPTLEGRTAAEAQGAKP